MSDSTDKLVDLAGTVMVIGVVDRMVNGQRKRKKSKSIFDF